MKIGILTHYYKSTNYGGNLQAYALAKFLCDRGFDAEQICYKRINDLLFGNRSCPQNIFITFAKQAVNWIRKWNINKRNMYIRQFNQDEIPHSRTVYTKDTLHALGDKYDLLIVGSDQVWHPKAVCDAYLLKFQTNAKRIAYAASFAVDFIEPEIADYYRDCLKQFNAISVRESEGQALVKRICGRNADLVLDPTLLLAKSDWETIIEPANIGSDYIFCYFLGNSMKQRSIAQQFADKIHLPIVNLPYLNGRNNVDRQFGKYRLFDVSPCRLLYLIQNAKFVFTDSFHATVFSILFGTRFFTFERNGMSSRLRTLTDIFNLQAHFCNDENKMTLDYLVKMAEDMDISMDKFNLLRRQSEHFLMTNLVN